MDSQDKEDHPLLHIRLSKWRTVLFWIGYVNCSLMLGSLLTPRWVKQGSKASLWKGSLLKCGGCDGEWEDSYYYSISRVASENKVDGYAATFKSLYISGAVYLSFEVGCLACYGVLFVLVSGLVVRNLNDGILAKAHFIIFLFHTIGMISWFSISKAKLTQDCSVSSDYVFSRDICATQGPILAVIVEILSFFSFILILVIKKNNNKVSSEMSTSR